MYINGHMGGINKGKRVYHLIVRVKLQCNYGKVIKFGLGVK